MSGLELQSRLSATNRQVPIIFISALSDRDTRAKALEAGALDFLQKPFSDRALFDTIGAALVR